MSTVAEIYQPQLPALRQAALRWKRPLLSWPGLTSPSTRQKQVHYNEILDSRVKPGYDNEECH